MPDRWPRVVVLTFPALAFLVLTSLVLTSLALTFLACDEPIEFYPAEITDTYQQDSLRMVDVLLVVDSSGSMEEEQSKLAANFQAFIAAFQDAQVDYHIGVITTDVDNLAEAGILTGEEPVITLETENQAEVFAANVQVGTEGSGLEMGFEAARLALSEPRVSIYNYGFYREEAALSLVFVSDEDDLSPYEVDDYLNFFAQLKGAASYRDHQRMNISAVAGDVPYGCFADDGSGEAYAAPRYQDAAARTEGVFASICAEDFSPIVQALGLDISGLRDEFPLTRCPRTETLEVVVGARIDTLGQGYAYLPERRSIRFYPNWIPEPGAVVQIHYEFYPEETATCPES